MRTVSVEVGSAELLSDALAPLGVVDDRRLLIQVFSGPHDEPEVRALRDAVAARFPTAVIIGATTDGTIHQGRVSDKSVLAFSHFEGTELRATLVEAPTSFETGVRCAQAVCGDDTALVICFADGTHCNGEELLQGFSSVHPDVLVAGGMAGDNGRMKRTLVFDRHGLTDHGAVAVSLGNPELQTHTHYSFNWLPLGRVFTVTSVVGNRVYRINDMTPVELYGRYLGSEVAAQLPEIGMEFPLVLQRGGQEIGRAVIDRHDDGSLVFAGNIVGGEKVRFGVGVVDRIIAESTRQADILFGENIESIFVYSCMARRRFLQERVDAELAPLQRFAPTTGFFTYGEFYSCRDTRALHNETMTYAVLSEGGNAKPPRSLPQGGEAGTRPRRVNAMQAMGNLANMVSQDLEGLNASLEKRLEEQKQKIYRQVHFDALTGLPNRAKLVRTLAQTQAGHVLVVNVDRFSMINDFYGFPAGEALLVHLRDRLAGILEAGHELYKLPADEFAIICTRPVLASLDRLSTELRSLVFAHEGFRIDYSVTVGAAEINSDGSGLAQANIALKQAKRSRKPFALYDPVDMPSRVKQNLDMAAQIKEALAADRIVPHYQPIIDARTGRVAKFECLARLITPANGVVPPFHFLPVAQQIRLYDAVSRAIVRHTVAAMRGNDLRFSINLAIDDIADEPFRAFLFEVLQDRDVAGRLTFEILETQAAEDEAGLTAFISAAAELGAAFAIDDFGSGYANFERVARIRARYLKIDGSLIKTVDTDPTTRLVVETIVAFARKLGIETVAEYVHSESVYQVVKQVGIDYAQGFHLGKPLPHPVGA